MLECKRSVHDPYGQTFTMGNYLDASFWSDRKASPTSVDMIKKYIFPAITGSQPQTEEARSWYASIEDVDSLYDDSVWMACLLPDEKQKVRRFKFADDQKRALLSILLQRALTRAYFGISDDEYDLQRSREGKPFPRPRTGNRDFGTWNFNVSHHGKFVCIVAHSHVLIGADIVDITTRSNMHKDSAMDFVRMFDSQLTPQEMRDIGRQRTETAKYSYFYLIWSLKEAFIKAIGQGLGYDLTQVEFTVHLEPGCDLNISPAPMSDRSQFQCAPHPGSAESKETWSPQSITAMGASGQQLPVKGYATVRVDGELRHDWRMEFASVDDKHVMTVARGPLHEALPTFIAQAGWPVTPGQLQQQDASVTERHRAALAVPMPLAQYRHPRELLPGAARS